MKEAYLIIDIGTGSVRTAAVSAESGEILEVRREKTRILSDPRFEGAQYFEPRELLETILQLMEALVRLHPELTFLAVSAASFREGIVLLDKEGRALAGYSNADRRGQAEMESLDWQWIFELTGLEKSAIYSAVKMMGARRLEPELYARTAAFTSVGDWIGYALTGELCWERAQAMHSALYDPVKDAWSEELCAMTGIPMEMLPPLTQAGRQAGQISPAICRCTGLPEGTPWVTGTADTQAALVPLDPEPGCIVIVSGTTSPCLRIRESFQPVRRSWVSPAAVPGQFMTEVNTFSCGINLQRFKDSVLRDLSYEQLDADALALGLPGKGLPALHAVFMNGMHIDKAGTAGGFVMNNPMGPELRREDYFHALSLNVAMGIALCVQRHLELDPERPSRLLGVGGGLVSPVIGQCIADLTGMELHIPAGYREATVLGEAFLCARALERPHPQPAGKARTLQPAPTQALKAYFEKWQQLRRQLNP